MTTPLAEHHEVRAAIDLLEAWTEAQPADSRPGLAALVRRYRNAWGDVQILVRAGELSEIGLTAPDPLLATATLKPVGEHTFRVETKDGYSISGKLAVFELDATGRATRVRFGENYMERIET